MVTLPLKPDSKFVEMPDNHHWFWYMKKDSPWLEFRNSQGTNKVTAYGEIRSWIEETRRASSTAAQVSDRASNRNTPPVSVPA